MHTFLTWLTKQWVTNSPFRHGVGAFLAVELAPYLTNVYQWSVGNASFPDVRLFASYFGKAVVGAVVLYVLRQIQKPKAS